MANRFETPPATANRGQLLSANSSDIIKKLSPYGKGLFDRQRFENAPFLAVVCVGRDAWKDAKQWQQRHEIEAAVLPARESPDTFVWPVKNFTCLIDWSGGAGVQLVIDLASALLAAGAATVTVWPSFVDRSKLAVEYDPSKPEDERFVQVRHAVKTYCGAGYVSS